MENFTCGTRVYITFPWWPNTLNSICHTFWVLRSLRWLK